MHHDLCHSVTLLRTCCHEITKYNWKRQNDALIHQSHRHTCIGGQHACDRNAALCTIVHRAGINVRISHSEQVSKAHISQSEYADALMLLSLRGVRGDRSQLNGVTTIRYYTGAFTHQRPVTFRSYTRSSAVAMIADRTAYRAYGAPYE